MSCPVVSLWQMTNPVITEFCKILKLCTNCNRTLQNDRRLLVTNSGITGENPGSKARRSSSNGDFCFFRPRWWTKQFNFHLEHGQSLSSNNSITRSWPLYPVSELSAFCWCAMVVVFSLHVIMSVLFLLDEPMGGWVQKKNLFSKRLWEDQVKFVPWYEFEFWERVSWRERWVCHADDMNFLVRGFPGGQYGRKIYDSTLGLLAGKLCSIWRRQAWDEWCSDSWVLPPTRSQGTRYYRCAEKIGWKGMFQVPGRQLPELIYVQYDIGLRVWQGIELGFAVVYSVCNPDYLCRIWSKIS